MTIEPWEPTEKILEQAISFVEEFFGEEWLQEQNAIDQAQKPKQFSYKFTHHLKQTPHPLFSLHKKSKETLSLIKSSKQAFFDEPSLELISIIDNLKKIKRIDIVDFNGKRLAINSEEKFRERLKPKDGFFQTLYEIQIAVALARCGFSVSFINETNLKKTPDIRVVFQHQTVYVECKYQGLTNRESQYQKAFNEFYWHSMKTMFSLGEFCSICVEWLQDPTINDAIELANSIEEMIRTEKFGASENNKARIVIEHLAERGQEFDGPFNIDMEKYRSDNQHIDIIMPQAHAGIFDNKPKYKNPTVVAFKGISYLDDLVNGALDDINKAYAQIPQDGPSILFVENRLSFLDIKLQVKSQELQNRIERKIGGITRVNRVIITKSYFTTQKVKKGNQTGVGIFRALEKKNIENLNAVTQISKDLLERINNLKFY